jgi:hypothetical protein
MELGEHHDAFFHSQLLKIEAAMAFWVPPGKKQVCTDMLGLLSPKTTLNLC